MKKRKQETEFAGAVTLGRQFRLEGFLPGKPPWAEPQNLAIDRRVCSRARCGCCNHRGLTFHPWFNPTTKSYKAAAVCDNCGAAEEF